MYLFYLTMKKKNKKNIYSYLNPNDIFKTIHTYTIYMNTIYPIYDSIFHYLMDSYTMCIEYEYVFYPNK